MINKSTKSVLRNEIGQNVSGILGGVCSPSSSHMLVFQRSRLFHVARESLDERLTSVLVCQ